MGIVYKARDRTIGQKNISNIHDTDETGDGQMFIVMACYERESLKEEDRAGSFHDG